MNAAPKCRRYQFSLRTMFVWVAVVAVLLTVGLRWVAPAQRQRAAVKVIERVGGSVLYADPQKDERGMTTWLRDWLPQQ